MFEGWGIDCSFDDEDERIPIDDGGSSDVTGSPAYSDRWSSDTEECMYGKIHHSLDIDSVLLDNSNDDRNGVTINSQSRGSPVTNQRNSIGKIIEDCLPTGISDVSNDPRNDLLKSGTTLDTSSSFSILPGSSLSQKKSKISSSRRKAQKKDCVLSDKFSRRLPSAQASTPILCFKKNRNDSSIENSLKQMISNDSDDESSDDDVVFVSAVDNTNNNYGKKNNSGSNENSSISKTSKRFLSLKRNYVSDSSSDEMICIDSTGSSDDLMTNVKDSDEKSSMHHCNNSTNTGFSDIYSVIDTDSSESNSVSQSSESWHIDMEDRMANYSERKSRKDRWSKFKRCKKAEANQCSDARNTKCYLCGGLHKSLHCKKKVCGLCYSFGHDRAQCSYPMHSVTCGHCRVVGHMACRCPDIWRRYHVTTSPSSIIKGPENVQQETIYCYNCGEDGHFGHECRKPRLCHESSACTPYVISYKDPNKLMRTKSLPASWNGKFLPKKMTGKKSAVSKFSKTYNFQRTPKTAVPKDEELRQLLKVHKKRVFKKKKKSRNMGMLLQQTL